MADIVVSAAGVAAPTGAPQISAIAGETLTAGQPVYLDPANSYQAKRCLASGTATQCQIVGVALNGASSGQPVQIMTAGDLTLTGTTLNPGSIYMVSTNVGSFAPSTDYNAATTLTLYGGVVGIAISATVLRLDIKYTGVQRV